MRHHLVRIGLLLGFLALLAISYLGRREMATHEKRMRELDQLHDDVSYSLQQAHDLLANAERSLSAAEQQKTNVQGRASD